MDAAPPAFDLAHDAPAAFHAASGSGSGHRLSKK